MIDSRLLADIARVVHQVNGHPDKAVRPTLSDRRAVFLTRGRLRLFTFGTVAGERAIVEWRSKMCGVYTPGVTVEQVREDVEAMA